MSIQDISHINTEENKSVSPNNSGHDLALYYTQYREQFINFGKKYGLVKEDIIDVFQDAVIVFLEQKEQGKLREIKCSDKTYLFSIGKYKMIDLLKLKNKNIITNMEIPEIKVDPEIYQKIEISNTQVNIKKALQVLGDSCQELIELFYYKRYSIKSIAAAMGYKSDNVVKAQKSRCMKTLRELLIKNGIHK